MKNRPLCLVCLIFFMIKSIILMTGGGDYIENMPAASAFRAGEAQKVRIQGQVYQKIYKSKFQILYLKNNSFYESNIMIYDKQFQNVSIGSCVEVMGETELFEEAKNPGNFNARQFYGRQKMYGFIWSEKIVEISKPRNLFRESLYQLRQKWKQFLFEVIGKKNGAVLSAMLLGERSEMDEDVKELYQKNGIAHILAISGLHISFIGIGFYQLLRKCCLPYWISGICSVLLLAVYVMMTGISVSAVRAAVMLLFRLGAEVTGRVYDMPTALSCSALLTSFWRPFCFQDAGFLLSYGAILGILLFLPIVERICSCKILLFQGIFSCISIHIIIFPIILYFYFEFSPYSFLLNLFVIPMLPWVLGCGMAGVVCVLFWKPAAVLLFRICAVLLESFEFLSRFGSRISGSRIVFGRPKTWKIAFYYAVLFVIVLLFFYKKNRKKSVSNGTRMVALAVWAAMTVLFLPGHDTKGNIKVTVLHVGQGDGIFIQGPECGSYLIDGGSSDINKVGKYRIEPFLKSQGIGKLDYVFLSHGDSDHYSGVEEMIERQKLGVRIENLVLPVTYQSDNKLCRLASEAKKKGIRISVIDAGVSVREGKLAITCIQPDKNFTVREGNEASMVLDVRFGTFDMLCTGDVEGVGEEVLMQNLMGKTYDVLKVSHHGSKNATGTKFLHIVKPKVSIISSGEKNRYGHPHQETIKRLQECGSRILLTSECGAITLKSDGKKIEIEGFR